MLYKYLYNALAVYLYRRDNVHAGACQRSGCRPPRKAPAPCWRFSAPHGSAMHLLSPAGGGRGLNNCEEALTLASVLGWSALVSHRRCRCGTVDRLDAASHRTDERLRKALQGAFCMSLPCVYVLLGYIYVCTFGVNARRSTYGCTVLYVLCAGCTIKCFMVHVHVMVHVTQCATVSLARLRVLYSSHALYSST